jgi:hypothetical protein
MLNLGSIASALGDYHRARSLYVQCLLIRRELKETRGIVTCLAALGCTAASAQQYGRAATLFGAFDAQREATGASIPALFRTEYERRLGETSAALGHDAFTQACAVGRAMTMDQAVALALNEGTG